MSSGNDSLFLVLIILISFFWIAPSRAPDFKEKTVYFSYCSDFTHNSFSCPKNEKVLVMKLSYRIYLREQMVISKGAVERKPCVVYDENEWSCQNGNYWESMRDGNYSESGSSSIDEKGEQTFLPRYQQISFFVYLIF